MRNNPPSGPVADAVRELVESMGYFLLEFSSQTVKGRTNVHCVLHREGGIDLDSLTTVHRALQPRLEALLDSRDLRIEFSSPGMERVLKSFHEVAVFCNHPVYVLTPDDQEWQPGTITEADDASCRIVFDDGTQGTFTADALLKVRLAD
jgi:ribosome maturation factor RimP